MVKVYGAKSILNDDSGSIEPTLAFTYDPFSVSNLNTRSFPTHLWWPDIFQPKATMPFLYPACKGVLESALEKFRPARMAAHCAALLMLLIFATSASAQSKNALKSSNEIVLPGGLSEADIADGWIALFDGETLFGWRAMDESTNWQVINNTIHADRGKMSLLRTTTEFDDYQLKVDFLATADTNSGVFLRTNPDPKNTATDCYELNIANDQAHPFPTGSLVDRHKVELDFQNDQWRTFYATVQGDRVTVTLDGKTVNEYIDTSGLKRGYIGLQFNAGPISFRNVLLRPLGVDPIFNGKDLSQWDQSQTGESKFSVSDEGELKVTGGRGQLESRAQLANFVFSMQCRTNATGLNSGVFFRSIPGEFTNGYESQIQNQFKAGDRTAPVDCGTGGIFRQANARRINADDQQWFSKMIIANGPHVSVWVNGLQVTDWTDRRKPHPNPRKGLRKEKGTFILQGHDPTTDILFREIKARELSSRR